MENNGEIRSAVYCFLTLAKFLSVPVNEAELANIIEVSHTNEGEVLLLKFAAKYKLKAKLTVWKKKRKTKKLADILPVIAKDVEGHFFIIAKMKDDKAVVISNETLRPQTVSTEELIQKWNGTLILIARKGGETAETFFSFKWFIPTILRFKKEFLFVILAAFVVQILGILTPVMTQVVVDKVLSHHTLSTLNVLAVGIAIVYIYDLVLSLARGYLFTHTTNRIDVILSQRLFHHLFDLPLRYFESRRAGETVARVRELDTIRQFLTGTPLSSLIDLVFIVVYVVVLFLYSTSLAWLVIASIPVYAVLSLIVTPLFKKRLDEKFNAGAETSSFLVESIQGVQTVKAFALENKFEEKWGDLQADYVKAGYRTSMVSHTSGTIAQFIQKIFDLLILYFGALEVMNGTFSVGQLVAFRMLSGRISGPVLRLVQLWQEYQQASLSVRRIGDIFHSPTEVKGSVQITNLPVLKGKIRFDKVHFRYKADGPEAIKDMSFCIEPGSIIGIVGRSGSGKSTVSKLIQRLYIPEMGKITIDGIDISMIEPRQLRRQIGVVLQENFMFNGSVRDNIAIHVKSASFEQIMEAAQIAGAHDFILELTNGYDTIIGEKGVGLSGGQKQRIAIARAILANPGILIFDEATSALDYESESIIQNNLKEICKGRTVLIIAHRLSTLKEADKIMLIDSGNLAEYDTHENLLREKGIYYHLYCKQLRGMQMNRHSLGEESGYLVKHRKKRDRYLKYDFMPALLEIIERPSHIAGKIIILSVTMLVITAFLWAYFAQIDVVVNGQGMVIAKEDKSMIVSLSNGRVSRVFVEEGSSVNKGDVLLELDTEELDIAIQNIEQQMDKLEVKKEILTIYAENPDAEIQVQDYAMEYAGLADSMILENEIYHEQVRLYPSEKEYIALQYRQILAEEEDAVEDELKQCLFQLERYENEAAKMVITAPISGTVSDTVIHNPGENVLASTTLMTITPGEASLIFQSYIFDKDIRDIEVGNQVKVKLQAYPYADYGAVYGTIYSISEEAEMIEGMGNVYIVDISFDDGLNDNILLRQGLTGTAEIQIGTRSVMEYFLEPITDGLSNSLKENG